MSKSNLNFSSTNNIENIKHKLCHWQIKIILYIDELNIAQMYYYQGEKKV